MKKSIVDFADDELGKLVKDRHARLHVAHRDGLIDEHPSSAWNKDSATLRSLRNVASSKEIELHGDPSQEEGLGQDDPPAGPGLPRVERNGGTTAVDAAMAEDRAIRHRSGADVEGALHLAKIKRGGSTSGTRAAMADLIPGYGRLK